MPKPTSPSWPAELLLRGMILVLARGRGHQPDGAVGENAIHVEEDDFDAAGAFVRGQGHGSILDGTPGVVPSATME